MLRESPEPGLGIATDRACSSAPWLNAVVATFSSILVATDFSDNAAAALAMAARLREDYGATLRVAHVSHGSSVREALKAKLIAPGDDDDVLDQKLREARVARMEAFLAPLGAAATGVETVFLGGDPSREIVRYARDNGVDLIVLGRRGTTLGDVMLGSVAERVVRHAPCPVLITRRQ
jgi:nucleotide-binding universal stress UspA family protein